MDSNGYEMHFVIRGSPVEDFLTKVEPGDPILLSAPQMTSMADDEQVLQLLIQNPFLQVPGVSDWMSQRLDKVVMTSMINPAVRRAYTLEESKIEWSNRDKHTYLRGRFQWSIRGAMQVLADVHNYQVK